jgi:hypothetical protein
MSEASLTVRRRRALTLPMPSTCVKSRGALGRDQPAQRLTSRQPDASGQRDRKDVPQMRSLPHHSATVPATVAAPKIVQPCSPMGNTPVA